jgi:hypothetical protein
MDASASIAYDLPVYEEVAEGEFELSKLFTLSESLSLVPELTITKDFDTAVDEIVYGQTLSVGDSD